MSGIVYVTGIGPGNPEAMTVRARQVLAGCDVIVGYSVYNDLMKPAYPDKTYLTTPMTKEEERCRMALEEADKGQSVAMICSGDAGVYGMAGLILQLTKDYPHVEVEVVPGVTAALSGAALLGAPLISDFAVISLSDRLTPWEEIERRLRAAAAGDFSIVLYNPSSHKRKDYLARACRILLETLPENRPAGIADRIGRDGERVRVITLGELENADADMFSTVFIGSSASEIVNGKIVTKRGYRSERS
jgi:precorrin-3B C17-methyltransferase